MRFHNKKKGISLVELILSIAVLAILSVYVIQMFLLSQKLNEQAEALDQSVMLSETIFETVELDRSLESVFNAPLFKYAESIESSDVVSRKLYLDKNWNPVQSSETYLYTLSFTAEEIQALDYSVVDYKVMIQKEENSKVEQIYEIEMEKTY
jgi:prepilin-type N-terminal cleavage/methylation domain-containing protein